MIINTMKLVIILIPKAAIDVVVDLWPMIALCVITVMCFRVAYSFSKHKRLEVYKEFINLAFIIYIMLLFSLVTATDFSSYSNNFIPFKEMFRYSLNSPLFYRNVVGNIILFIPFGYFANYYCESKHIKISLIITTVVSFTIETIQLALGRSFDVDDIILNVIGGIVGYLLYVFVEFIFKKTTQRVKNSFLLNLIFIIIIIVLFVIILSLYGVVL